MIQQSRAIPSATPPVAGRTEARVINGISVDVEDWLQSTIDPYLPLTPLFYKNTQKVLEAFAARGVRGTFFVLGLAAEMAPGMVREIQAAGHEVQSHGYGHELVFTQTPEQFRADLERAKKLLEDLTGHEIYAYRAPAFSITRRNLWALDVLVETGHRYDSSIFPVAIKRYGVAGVPIGPHVARTPSGYDLLELPVSAWAVAGRRVPVGGGGYFRLFPYFLLRRGVQQLNRQGQPATIYMHPYEYNPIEFNQIDYPVEWKTRLHQGLGRRSFPGKVDRLVTEFRFGAMQDSIDQLGDPAGLPRHEYRP
jgi:polysaccharide deacetylase family protein (PEP-CTERM system associated)